MRLFFPIMPALGERKTDPGARSSIPWAMIAPHEAQAQANHGQSLERLADRQGLSPLEAVVVLENRPFPFGDIRAERLARTWLESHVALWMKEKPHE